MRFKDETNVINVEEKQKLRKHVEGQELRPLAEKLCSVLWGRISVVLPKPLVQFQKFPHNPRPDARN